MEIGLAIECRIAKPSDDDALAELWSVCYNEDRDHLKAVWRTIRDRYLHGFVAVTPEDKPIAAAHYWIFEIRDETGIPRKVAGLSHVATHPDYRRQGIARSLVQLALEGMRRDGCDWSFLFASDEGRPIYESLGWFLAPLPFRQGLLSADRPLPSRDYRFESLPSCELDGAWESLSRIHDAYNADRPLCVIRDESYWRDYLRQKFAGWPGSRIYRAYRNGGSEPVAYATAYFAENRFLLNEIGTLPGETDAIPALIHQIAEDAAKSGADRGRICLPHLPEIEDALLPLYQEIHVDQEGNPMAKPLSDDWNDERIRALLALPNAQYWRMDDF